MLNALAHMGPGSGNRARAPLFTRARMQRTRTDTDAHVHSRARAHAHTRTHTQVHRGVEDTGDVSVILMNNETYCPINEQKRPTVLLMSKRNLL